MAYRSLAFNNEIIWRAPLPSAERELANAIRDNITALRPHLLDFIRLNEEALIMPSPWLSGRSLRR